MYNKNKALLLAVIAKNAYVINATCSTGSIISCVISMKYSVFTFCFASWLWDNRRADSIDPTGAYFVFGLTPVQTLHERIENKLPVQRWHYHRHVSHEGVNHNSNGFHQVHATTVPFWNTTLEVHDDDNDGGFVGD
ncbi:hypothetical protein PsYK624_161560 [Phanerochaete sordida]|uniref:Uncharacterized protein n=1 Tax=Phanerochaete sordida TaxID=48140 RepID=A0A9P3LN31_9APHY|nr:hypothetical protein PsYK624_161560 [Phanerochaete sordida]